MMPAEFPWAADAIQSIERREFMTLFGGAATAWPMVAHAQQRGQIRRIGFLRAAPPPERELNAFVRALAEHGYVQGRNFVIVPQWGDGNVARLSELAVVLVNASVDVIVTEGTIVAQAAAAATSTVPIVMVGVADPFAGGLEESLAARWQRNWIFQPRHRHRRKLWRS
jgi:putative ABC transport system substrate-binding protein